MTTRTPAPVPPVVGPPVTERAVDRLAVRGLVVRGHHGVLDEERREGQDFVIDLVLLLDTAEAARTDDLRRTVDYGALVGDVVTAVERDPVDLIETLAQRIADLCLEQALVNAVEVTVHKPHAPIKATFSDVALTISRSRAATSGDPDPGPRSGHRPDPARSRA